MSVKSEGTPAQAIEYLQGLIDNGCTGTDSYITVTHDGDTCPIHEYPVSDETAG